MKRIVLKQNEYLIEGLWQSPPVILCGVLVESAMGPQDKIHKRLVVGS